MATPMRSPHSDATLRVADDLVERYEAAGYTRVAMPKAESKQAPKKAPSKSE